MKKKLSLFLLLVTIIFLVPVMVYAGTGRPTGSIVLTVSAPVLEETPPSVNPDYRIVITSETWTNQTDNQVLGETDTLVAGKKYYYQK